VRLRPELDTFTTVASLEFLDNVGGLRLLMALRTCAFDATSKRMVANAIKTVTFRNVHSDKDYAIRFNPATGDIFLACQFDRLQSEAGAAILSQNAIYEELMQHLNVRVAQKRKEIEDRVIPEREKELQEILGVPVKYEVVFPSFKHEDELNYVDNISGHRISMACRCIFGAPKDNLVKNFKTVRLFCVPNIADKSLAYENGVLTIKSCYSKGLDGAFGDGEIKAVLSQ